jgi:hypothetical protein
MDLPKREPARWTDRALGWAVFLGLLAGIETLAWYKGGEILPLETPPRENALATKALWHRHSLTPEHYAALWQEACTRSAAGQQVSQDVFAMAADGSLVPKHSLLTAFLAVPFYAVFGEVGFWLFNQVMVLIVYVSMKRLALFLYGREHAVVLAFLTLGGTQLGGYLFGFHYDVTALAFILAGFALIPTHPGLAGLLLGASVWIRFSNLLLIPFLFLAYRSPWRAWLRFAAGCGLLVAGLLALNAWLFGHPLRTGYHCLPIFVAGEFAGFDPHPVGFDRHLFLAEWPRKLFDERIGLLTQNLALWLWPLGLWMSWQRVDRRWLAWTTAGMALQVVYVFSYFYWPASHTGNRFLFPFVFLALLPVVALADLRKSRPESGK